MPNDLALYDLVSPYLLRGDTFGQWHAALAVLFVDEHSFTQDDTGIVVRGVARFDLTVKPWIDPSTMTFGITASTTVGHPENDPGRRDPWLDLTEVEIDFELTAPRLASLKVSAANPASIAGFTSGSDVLSSLDSDPNNGDVSDYPSTEFTLDLILGGVRLRPPFLIGAKLATDTSPGAGGRDTGILVEDLEHNVVTFTLPRLKVGLAQDSANGTPLTAQLLSLGASGLDGPSDLGVAQLVTMNPPYAFIGSSKVVGFAFRSATLDISEGSTPPDVLSQFGFDDSWTGLYLPEIRLYIAPSVRRGSHSARVLGTC